MKKSITLYGIPNCDTVKKARAWLAQQPVEVFFHDFKKLGVPTDRLDDWLSAVGWEKLLNRQGSTWRKLDPAAQATLMDAADPVQGARALMQEHPSIIKRPVVEWSATEVTVGFDAIDWARRL